jgi:hypothetical protein
MRIGSGTQTDDEFLTDEARRSRPWTEADYLRLHRAALAFTRTRDGHAYWELLGALDRTGTRD